MASCGEPLMPETDTTPRLCRLAACSLLTCFTDDSGAAKVEKEAAAINTAAMLGISFMIDSRCSCLLARCQ